MPGNRRGVGLADYGTDDAAGDAGDKGGTGAVYDGEQIYMALFSRGCRKITRKKRRSDG